ncbi:MAG: DUF4097 family beta strand repeat-containing protein [Arenimonas sp.]
MLASLLLVAGSVQADPPAAAPDAAASAIAAIRSDYDVMLKPGQAIVVDNPYGNVSARFGGFEHKVETHAVLQEPAGAVHIELKPGQDSAGRYSLAPRLPAGTTLAQGQRLDLALFVPEGHALSVDTKQGQIQVYGVHSNVQLRSEEGDIKIRGIKGAIVAETGEGSIEAALGTAPRKASQRLATRTGEIRIGVDDHLDAALDMATSGLFATEYSLKVARKPGEEPNKRAQSVIGEAHSRLLIESKRGQISVFRRAKFTATGGQSSAAQDQEEEQEDNDSD